MNIQQNKLSSGGFCFVLAISTSKHIINEILKLLLEHKRIRSAYIIYMWGEVGDSYPVFFLKTLSPQLLITAISVTTKKETSIIEHLCVPMLSTCISSLNVQDLSLTYPVLGRGEGEKNGIPFWP